MFDWHVQALKGKDEGLEHELKDKADEASRELEILQARTCIWTCVQTCIRTCEMLQARTCVQKCAHARVRA